MKDGVCVKEGTAGGTAGGAAGSAERLPDDLIRLCGGTFP